MCNFNNWKKLNLWFEIISAMIMIMINNTLFTIFVEFIKEFIKR
jgi:hypothetical protein